MFIPFVCVPFLNKSTKAWNFLFIVYRIDFDTWRIVLCREFQVVVVRTFFNQAFQDTVWCQWQLSRRLPCVWPCICYGWIQTTSLCFPFHMSFMTRKKLSVSYTEKKNHGIGIRCHLINYFSSYQTLWLY